MGINGHNAARRPLAGVLTVSRHGSSGGQGQTVSPPPARAAMDKRRLGITLLLISLEFGALAHTILAVIFNTGLGPLSAVGGGIILVVLVLING